MHIINLLCVTSSEGKVYELIGVWHEDLIICTCTHIFWKGVENWLLVEELTNLW